MGTAQYKALLILNILTFATDGKRFCQGLWYFRHMHSSFLTGRTVNDCTHHAVVSKDLPPLHQDHCIIRKARNRPFERVRSKNPFLDTSTSDGLQNSAAENITLEYCGITNECERDNGKHAALMRQTYMCM